MRKRRAVPVARLPQRSVSAVSDLCVVCLCFANRREFLQNSRIPRPLRRFTEERWTERWPWWVEYLASSHDKYWLSSFSRSRLTLDSVFNNGGRRATFSNVQFLAVVIIVRIVLICYVVAIERAIALYGINIYYMS